MTLSLPLSIWVLSFSSFLLNFSSVILFGCASLILGEFCLKSGEIEKLEGTVEGLALIIRAIVGWISDVVGRRKTFLLWGYGISSLSRFLFTSAPYLSCGGKWIAGGSRVVEKIGNGLQASPREAFIGDVAPPDKIGQAYGLNKALSMGGSFMGSAIMLIFWLCKKTSTNHILLLLKISTFLSILSFLSIKFFVKEPENQAYDPVQKSTSKTLAQKLSVMGKFKKMLIDEFKKIIGHIKEFKFEFWRTIFIIFIFKLGYFSGMVIMNLLAQSQHLSFFGHSLYKDAFGANSVFLAVQNFTCCLLAYPFGRLSDRLDRSWVVSLGFLFMITSLLIFANTSSYSLYIAIAIYGLQMSVQGALLALLNNTMPAHLHGTGFGLFFLVSGISVILINRILPLIKHAQSLSMGFLVIGGLISSAFWFLPLISEQKSEKNHAFLWTCRVLSLIGVSLCIYSATRHWI